MAVLKNLQPARVFFYFEEISGIPRASGNPGPIQEYLVNFAKSHGLEYCCDVCGNVAIFKKAYPGYEDREPVIIQGHTDMVAQASPDKEHDFASQGIDLAVEDGYIHADRTTLGADDGIAVAMALAVLEDPDLPHPALTVLLTTDEEVGMTGAERVTADMLRGTRLINIDSEEEGTLVCACAGGCNVESRIPVHREEITGKAFRISLSGLSGGHSGTSIGEPKANANQLIGRILGALDSSFDIRVVRIDGGDKHNVIAQSAEAVIVAGCETGKALLPALDQIRMDLIKEYDGSEHGLRLVLEEEQSGNTGEVTISGSREEFGSDETQKEQELYRALDADSQKKVIFFLEQLPHGVLKMSGSIPGMVETSANDAIVRLTEKELYTLTSVRSSFASARDAVAERICRMADFLGGTRELTGVYPAWEYRPDSSLRRKACELWETMYHQPLRAETIHAGLECGLFADKKPGLDCISIGPDIPEIHSVRERLDIASTQRLWAFLLRLLRELQ